MAKTSTVIIAGVVAAAAIGLTVWYLFFYNKAGGCGGHGNSTNCVGAVGSVKVTSYPPNMPINPTWTPCVNQTYNLCATAELQRYGRYY